MHSLFKKKALTKTAIVIVSLILLLSINPLNLSAFTLGDINDDGRIDVQDVTLVARHVLGIETLSSSQMEAADVNGDGSIDVQDIALTTQKALGTIDDFDDETETLDEIAVHFIDVGQGDSIFINTSEQNILIDGGNRGATTLNYLQDLGVDKLDLVIGTHPHAHVGGLINVMEIITVESVVDPGVVHTTKTFEDYLEIIDEKDIEFIEGRAGMSIDLGDGAELKVVHPVSPSSNHLNNASIVVRMTYGDVSFIFAGDAEKEAEAEMINRDYVLDSTILKVGHHGSRTSTTQEFLEAVKPEVAVIMCGLDNTYGHPHEETLDKLSAANVDIYRTDLHGTVIVTTDGSGYDINTDPYEHEDETEPEPGNDENEEEKVEDTNDEANNNEEPETDPVAGYEHPFLPSEPLYLYADDGTYLGKLTTNQFKSDSIFNQFGTYGSQFSSTSIWNNFGRYGGDFSSQSPFNDFTSTPPYIVTADGELVGRLTTNRFITGAVSPYDIEDILLQLGL